MTNYILQTMAFQVLFLLIYDVILKKETFFNWNRAYLLITTVLSIVLPFIKLETFKNVVPQNYIVALPEVIIGQTTNNNASILNGAVAEYSNALLLCAGIFCFGMALSLGLFLFKFTKILVLIAKNKKTYSDNLILVKLANSNAAFSFFRYVFLGDSLEKEEKETILKHEMIHVNHLHSIDLLFFEILRILFWFNPLLYIYQNRMTTLHEFIADAEAVKLEGKSKYYQNLLTQVFDTKKIAFINPFFKQSLIKKRIQMLQKSKSKQIKLFKYVLLMPIVCGMLVYTSCDSEGNNTFSEERSVGELISDIQLKHEKQGSFSDSQIQALLDLVATNTNNKNKNKKVNGWSVKAGTMEYITDAIPLSEVEKPPMFPGCKGAFVSNQKDCMSKKIHRHFTENFYTNELADGTGLEGFQRIMVRFKVNKQGDIIPEKTEVPHPVLEQEFYRLINLLPKMIPGEHKGEKVNVLYSLPLTFKL